MANFTNLPRGKVSTGWTGRRKQAGGQAPARTACDGTWPRPGCPRRSVGRGRARARDAQAAGPGLHLWRHNPFVAPFPTPSPESCAPLERYARRDNSTFFWGTVKKTVALLRGGRGGVYYNIKHPARVCARLMKGRPKYGVMRQKA